MLCGNHAVAVKLKARPACGCGYSRRGGRGGKGGSIMRSSPRFDTIAPTGLTTFRKHTKSNRARGILKCSKIAPAEKQMQMHDTTRNSSRKDQDCHANAGLSHRDPISSQKKKKNFRIHDKRARIETTRIIPED